MDFNFTILQRLTSNNQRVPKKRSFLCPHGYFFFEGNGFAEVEEGDSKDTLACDDDAHKVDVCT